MIEKPIRLSGPEVRAILDGRKSQTRMIIKLPTKGIYEHPKMGGWAPTTAGGDGCFRIRTDGTQEDVREKVAIWHQTCGRCIATDYQVGDRLWVREAWRTAAFVDDVPPRDLVPGLRYISFEADYDSVPNDGCRGRYRHARFMPRWASRITLEVTKVRVQRLQDISENDAEAEGARAAFTRTTVPDWPVYSVPSHRWGFEELWTSLHGPGAWSANPWVVAITFNRIK